MIYKHTSSKHIIRKVFRDLKPNNANWVDDAVEWMGEALEHIGASAQLCTKKAVLKIKDHKAVLPGDLYYINQVAVNNFVKQGVRDELDELIKLVEEYKANIAAFNEDIERELTNRELTTQGRLQENAIGKQYSSVFEPKDVRFIEDRRSKNILELNEINSRIIVLEGMFFNVSDSAGGRLTPLSYGSSTFPDAIHCEDCINEVSNAKDSYIIDCDYIKTSFPTGEVCLSYKAFPVDEECYPMIPDDISYKEALFWYIYKQLLLGGFDKPTNKIDYNFADQKWNKYCSQARANASFPDIDKMDSFMNQWVRLIPDVNAHSLFFEELNSRENLNRSL